MADIAHACEGVSRNEANHMVLQLIEKYDVAHKTVEKGKSFVDCYDLRTIQPTAEWQGMYEQALREMDDIGLSL